MKKRDREGDKSNIQNKVIKILGTTSACGITGVLNYHYKIIEPENIVLTILLVLAFVLSCFVLLQDDILPIVNRICKCIEQIVKFKEETKRVKYKSFHNKNKYFSYGNGITNMESHSSNFKKDDNSIMDKEGCKTYEIQRKLK